tara:strand:- start:1856 stop:2185 length:330 start_codon:yes stop_codon:yes gene_type:complete
MKIFLFGLVIVFFVFKIGFWSNAYSNTIKLGPTEDGKKISSGECMKVLNFGKIMEYPNPEKGQLFWLIIYNQKEYFIQKSETTINTGMSNNFISSSYVCLGVQKLIPSD